MHDIRMEQQFNILYSILHEHRIKITQRNVSYSLLLFKAMNSHELQANLN